MAEKSPRGKKPAQSWTVTTTVRHYRTGKVIRRRDGKPLRFPRR